MSPVEVAEAYYGAFGELDHLIMEACVTGKAGKGDINMVLNLYVIDRVRQAYERNMNSYISAQEWVDSGRPITEKNIFGITDLSIIVMLEVDEKATLAAEYILWTPGELPGESPNESPQAFTEDDISPHAEYFSLLPKGLETKDTLSLVFQKGAWRIAEIERIIISE
jgi:hypothetical protein